MSNRAKHDGERVWIDGVAGWHIGEQGSSVHAAQAAAMKALGEDISYTDLLGYSGLAFRLQVHKALCPSSPHSFCGKQCVKGAVSALPWRIQVHEVKEDDAEGVKKARKAVKASIDRRVPVQYGSEEDGLIVGYQKEGAEWICYHPLKKGGKETFVETKWPWGIAIFTERKAEQPDRRELAISSLRQAVDMASADDVEEYTLGSRAWDVWLQRLRELESADDKACGEWMMGNSWIYGTLVEYRTHAARYLRSVSGLFDEETEAHIRSAADRYEQLATKVLIDGDKCPMDVAPPPWYLKKGQKWTPEWRADQIRRLEAARPLEERALKEIGLALALIE